MNRTLSRVLAAAGAAITLPLVVATPASASPEDGKGCVGTPTLPDAYVCVISVDAGGALPTVTTTPMPVTVPPVCYFVACTPPTPVNVPIPSASEGSGAVLVLWYKGVYYPFAVSSGTVVSTLVETVDTGAELAGYYAGVLLSLYEDTNAGARALADEYAALVLGLAGQVEDELRPVTKSLSNYLYGVLDDVTDPVGVACRTVAFAWWTAGGGSVYCSS